MWSVRMRGSVAPANRGEGSALCRKRGNDPAPIHITGGEGLYEEQEVAEAAAKYLQRALGHPRGKPDTIVITIEDLKEKPKTAKAPLLSTLNCKSPPEAKKAVFKILRELGISEAAIKTAFSVLKAKHTIRGASIISRQTGSRLEPDKARGVRVSRMGIEKNTLKALSKELSRLRINRDTVKEALTLAAKVMYYPKILAEVCISDDPSYTTGYIASKKLGYLRIPHIKQKGGLEGGRAFFVSEDTDIKHLIDYLEKTPVIIERLSEFKGIVELNEILGNFHR